MASMWYILRVALGAVVECAVEHVVLLVVVVLVAVVAGLLKALWF